MNLCYAMRSNAQNIILFIYKDEIFNWVYTYHLCENEKVISFYARMQENTTEVTQIVKSILSIKIIHAGPLNFF